MWLRALVLCAALSIGGKAEAAMYLNTCQKGIFRQIEQLVGGEIISKLGTNGITISAVYLSQSERDADLAQFARDGGNLRYTLHENARVPRIEVDPLTLEVRTVPGQFGYYTATYNVQIRNWPVVADWDVAGADYSWVYVKAYTEQLGCMHAYDAEKHGPTYMVITADFAVRRGGSDFASNVRERFPIVPEDKRYKPPPIGEALTAHWLSASPKGDTAATAWLTDHTAPDS